MLPVLLDFQHPEVLKLLPLCQAAHSPLSPCCSRKPCFTARFALCSHCHLFGSPPHFFLLSEINAKLCQHLQLPISLCLTLPPTAPLPPPPVHTHVLTGSWYYLPVRAARSLVHCISWNHSCTKKREDSVCQHPNHRLHSCTATTSRQHRARQLSELRQTGGYSRFSLCSSGCRAAWRTRVKAGMLWANSSK